MNAPFPRLGWRARNMVCPRATCETAPGPPGSDQLRRVPARLVLRPVRGRPTSAARITARSGLLPKETRLPNLNRAVTGTLCRVRLRSRKHLTTSANCLGPSTGDPALTRVGLDPEQLQRSATCHPWGPSCVKPFLHDLRRHSRPGSPVVPGREQTVDNRRRARFGEGRPAVDADERGLARCVS